MYSKLYKIKKYTKSGGFSLLEMIVAVGLFAVVATIALGTLLTATTANRKSKTERIALDSLGFALDDITQNVRFGGSYDCDTANPPTECTSSLLKLVGPFGTPVYYRRNVVSGRGVIQRSPDGSSWLNLTDPSVNITGLALTVHGVTAAVPPRYPRVLVRVKGMVTNPDTKAQTSFAFQTTIAQRATIAQ